MRDPGMNYNRAATWWVFGCLGGLALLLAVGVASLVLDWLR